MFLLFIAFLGGALTILSPCVLPVLPFVFARAGRSFLRAGLPMLIGMMVTFVLVATLAAVGGSWVVRVNEAGRLVAMAVIALFGLALLSEHFAELLARPAVQIGNRLLNRSSASEQPEILGSFLLGIATGLLWAPCAGPILGLILTGAALSGPSTRTVLLLLSYAAGAATSLGLATLAGARVFALMKKSLGAGVWLRRALGAAVLASVAIIVLGWDTGILTRWSRGSSGPAQIEQALLDRLTGSAQGASPVATLGAGHMLPVATASEAPVASLEGVTSWLDTQPVSIADLKGKVVLVDFWTYSCINCLRSLPHVKALYERYKSHGLVVIGVHSPEFAFERDEANVRRAVAELGVSYPVGLDNNFAVWRGFGNKYWPAHFLIDADGRVRAHVFGEGHDAETEATVRWLLMSAGYRDLPPMDGEPAPATAATPVTGPTSVAATPRSPETYVGYARAARFAGEPALARDAGTVYQAPPSLAPDSWALDGPWTVERERATAQGAGAAISFQFRGRALHLVLGTGAAPVGFTVLIDGHEPQAAHGSDTDEHGRGVVREERLYRLVDLGHADTSHRVSIRFDGAGASAYAFTFD